VRGSREQRCAGTSRARGLGAASAGDSSGPGSEIQNELVLKAASADNSSGSSSGLDNYNRLAASEGSPGPGSEVNRLGTAPVGVSAESGDAARDGL